MPTRKHVLNQLISEKSVHNPTLVLQINGEGEVFITVHVDSSQEEHLSRLAIMVLGLMNGNLDNILLASLPVEVLREIDRLQDAFDEADEELIDMDEPVMSPFQTLSHYDESEIEHDHDLAD